MTMLREIAITVVVLRALFGWHAQAAEPPPLMLANVYHAGDAIDLSAYWISEKFDGVRGYWDGHRLWTPGGTPVREHAWFTAGWPTTPLPSQLWAVERGSERPSVTAPHVTTDESARPSK